MPAFGGFQPSFGLDYSAWSATDIVLADITAQGDDFQVVESWKGDLKTATTSPCHSYNRLQMRFRSRFIPSKAGRIYHPATGTSRTFQDNPWARVLFCSYDEMAKLSEFKRVQLMRDSLNGNLLTFCTKSGLR